MPNIKYSDEFYNEISKALSLDKTQEEIVLILNDKGFVTKRNNAQWTIKSLSGLLKTKKFLKKQQKSQLRFMADYYDCTIEEASQRASQYLYDLLIVSWKNM